MGTGPLGHLAQTSIGAMMFLVAVAPYESKADAILSDALIVVSAAVAAQLDGKNYNDAIKLISDQKLTIDRAIFILEGETQIEAKSLPFEFEPLQEVTAMQNILTTSARGANGNVLAIPSTEPTFREAPEEGLSDVVLIVRDTNLLKWSLCNDIEDDPDMPAHAVGCLEEEVTPEPQLERPNIFVDVTLRMPQG